MNYRHGFHAGNHADVLKHMVLAFCLDALKRKSTPFAVLDTHAGAGLYDLTSEQAQRSPEWKDGIGKIWDWGEAAPALRAYLDAIRAFNRDGALSIYPGSPALIARALRADDLLIAGEKHPEEAELLRQHLARLANVQLHERDGWEALGALLPPAKPRGLVLIDPPYEELGELARSAGAIAAALKRFRHGQYLWWRPLKSGSGLERADDELHAQIQAAGALDTLRADLWIDTPKPEGKLSGSSLLLINPPFGLKEALEKTLPALAERLATGQAGYRLFANGEKK